MKSNCFSFEHNDRKYYINVETHQVMNSDYYSLSKSELQSVRLNGLNDTLIDCLRPGSEHEIQKHARLANETENYELAGRLVTILLDKNNKNPVAMAINCSLLRAQNKSKEAYLEFVDYVNRGGQATHAILTSVAAALLDMKNIKSAKKYADRALAMLNGKATDHLNQVYRSIRSLS